MTRRRWIADEVSGNHAALTGAHAGHLVRVLRARVGQEFDIATTAGVRRGRISSINSDGDRVEFELGEELAANSIVQVTVALSIFKFDRMEWAIEKCTELGVTNIVPVIARRTEAHLAEAAIKRVERWRRIGQSASEQSRRGAQPEISQPLKIKEAVALPGGLRIVLAEAEQDLTLKSALGAYTPGAGIVLAIGPEGGWASEELELFHQANWISATLGDTILRAETAAVASVAVVLAECEE